MTEFYYSDLLQHKDGKVVSCFCLKVEQYIWSFFSQNWKIC